ncbi:helix-turn-helix domain-containing protein [Pseudomonas lactucae]|uniref:XRE family transcriptional regulator n=1 Tax=Pseudomonas lactucae TaxID=2813360 RepID=A0A9X1C5B7_9PSED|nr:XRE family transcriptional regulator [Pseudomonas lactucae]MBN2975503.1 XRE family transcriptional regulator [Pseudomonas lactucae]MBN2987243.1 XRE family transcriptional regulator [Pseudomonas lactucae]
MSQNLFELFTTDPVEYNMKHLKTQLFMTLITLIRDNEWSQAVAAKKLNVSAPRMSNLFKGYLEKFSIDTLLEMLIRIGYKVDADFNPENKAKPFVMSVKKATL